MPLVLIPFAIFFVSVLAQFWFVRRVRQALVERHPALWLEISYKAWFLDNEMFSFALGRKYKELDDPVLTDRVRAVQLLMGIGIAAWVAIAAMIVTGAGFQT